MRLSALMVTFATWLLVNAAAASDLKDAVRLKRENSRDKDLASGCLWLCDCFRKLRKGGVHVVVECQQMLDFPMVTPNGTTDLLLNDNFIGQITDTSLQLDSLKDLEDFQCSNCRLTTIDANAFRHLDKLKTIDLRDNSIVHLTPAHFRHQKHLAVLMLTGNADLDCAPLKKELEGRTNNLAAVNCDDDFVSQPDVRQTVTVENADTTEKPDVTNRPTVTVDSSMTAENRDTIEKTGDRVVTSSLFTEDSSQTDSPTTSDEPETKRENDFVIIVSIVGAVIAFVIGRAAPFRLL